MWVRQSGFIWCWNCKFYLSTRGVQNWNFHMNMTENSVAAEIFMRLFDSWIIGRQILFVTWSEIMLISGLNPQWLPTCILHWLSKENQLHPYSTLFNSDLKLVMKMIMGWIFASLQQDDFGRTSTYSLQTPAYHCLKLVCSSEVFFPARQQTWNHTGIVQMTWKPSNKVDSTFGE